MKKFAITFLLISGFLIHLGAQLTVAEDNNVGINETSPESELSINGTGNTYSTLYVENNTTTSSQRCVQFNKSASGDNGSDYSFSVWGHIAHNGGYKLVGGQFQATSSTQTNYRTFGLRGIAGNGISGYNYGVFGYLYGTRNGAAVFGSITGSEVGISGRYAGYFTDDVKITGHLTVDGFTNNSDITLKKDVRELALEDSSQMVKLKNLTAIKYKFKTPAELNSIPSHVADTMKIDPRTIEYNADRYLKDQIGFSAQEVQQIYPELVKQGQDGYLSVNYIGLIPVLVEAMKEQDEIIGNLNQLIRANGQTFQTNAVELQTQAEIILELEEELQTQADTIRSLEVSVSMQASTILSMEETTQTQAETLKSMNNILIAQAEDIKVLKEEIDKLKNAATTE